MGRNAGEFYHGYTDEVYDSVLDLVAQGMPVKTVCAMEGMPHFTAIYQKCRAEPEFKAKLRDAQEWQARYWLEDVASKLADIRDGNIEAKSATAWINATKMVVEKMAPREYGVKTAIDHSSTDGSMSPKGASLDDFYANADVPSQSDA